MPVSDTHTQYNIFLPLWKKVRDCVGGSATVKEAGISYLPKPNPEDKSTQNTDRYNDYKARANYVNFTGHTKKGMSGMVFRKESTIELPTAIEYIKENANGSGLTLDQLTKDILNQTLETGRHGLLVDYPDVEEGLTQAQVNASNLQAHIMGYPSESVINWRTSVVSGKKVLSLVVLQEPQEKVSDDGFSVQRVMYHRVLALEEGTYIQYLYNENDEQVAEFIPRKSDGAAWDLIPFTFVGSENNDETIDEAPLYDLAEVNLAHYRNSADYEESSFMVGQPTLFLSGFTQTWIDDNLKGTVSLGSRGGIPGPEGATAELLQANPNQMPLEGMKEKEQQMIKIGARVIQDASGTETAEAAKIRFSGQNSQLADIVGNIESAVSRCIEWVSEFMGSDSGFSIEINRQFYDANLDAQQVMALVQLADRGDIAQPDVRSALRRAGWVDAGRTDEEIEEDLDGQGPLLSGAGQSLPSTEQEPQGSDLSSGGS